MTPPEQVLPGQTLPIDVDAVPGVELGPGVHVRMLPGMPGIRTWVVDLKPGAEWPELDVHETYGEAYFVVRGELIEGERPHGPGTYVAFGPNTSHRPRSETGVRAFGFNYDA
ncbi:cupin domain-containing protein [Nonomuraea roseoviolacea]|uniref:Mannose-6-phosphate isomerase-like protein (Cupin superfamily) n=1 Tax=Nonomuraea roseoviolacea subsp. carminata TaxID=160689 RepID=A0ABT1K2F1_9ACTN|nr:cupin domain-containing protein [Nonomuraea roseoviolacea]MCP2347814.1 mannose-6-phosphate isomerase-like protein (cupin superfamily) [Nonomuraea roseoviolacea subsp. carminata]